MIEVWGEDELGVGEQGSGAWESSPGVKGSEALGITSGDQWHWEVPSRK